MVKPMGPSNVAFALDERLLEQAGQTDLPGSLRDKGFCVTTAAHVPLHQPDESLAFDDNQCVVVYGSIGFVEQKLKNRSFIPGAYFSRTRFNCSSYLCKLPLDLIGNDQAVYMPFGEFVRRKDQLYRLFGESRLFIRPDSGAKVFTGLVIDRDEADFEINSLTQLTSVTDTTMILIAPAQRISREYRFFIVEGKVITGSQYMENGIIKVSAEVDPRCKAFADRVAALPWQIDLAYTCDVGVFYGEPKLVELNAFSTSGLYACDGLALFTAVADTAYREYLGEISISG